MRTHLRPHSPRYWQLEVEKEGKLLDLAAQLRILTKIPSILKELAVKILNDIPRAYETVYFGCDTYRGVSIKAPEWDLRGESQKYTPESQSQANPPQVNPKA